MFFLVSCSTIKGVNYKDKEAMMYGMVYDGKEIAVEEVSVYVDGKLKAVSDMRGRFILKFYYGNVMDKKKHQIRLEKDGYEKVQAEIFYDPMSLLYFRLRSGEDVIRETEEKIERAAYEDGEELAKEVGRIKGYEVDGKYLAAIIKLRKKEKAKALEILNTIEDENNEYVNKFKERIEQIQ